MLLINVALEPESGVASSTHLRCQATLDQMSGKVLNVANLALPQSHYDTLIIGAGLLGLATAFYLKKHGAGSVLVAEQGGVPSETGMSFASPAIFNPGGARPKERAWVRRTLLNLSEETGVTRPHDVPFRPVGLARFSAEASQNSMDFADFLETLDAEQTVLEEMLEPDHFRQVTWQPSGGYGSAEAAAYYYGYGAVKLGVDLLLNTKVTPLSPKEFRGDRLEYTRDMSQQVVSSDRITAGRVIVAAGSASMSLVEDALGELLPYGRVYQQYPRIETDPRLPLEKGRVRLPVISAHKFTLRPQGEGLLIVPPARSADPADYTPSGGKLMGVRVGLRREILEQLMAAGEQMPVLTWESLNLGKTLSKVRGAWQVVTPDGLPEWRSLGEDWYSLVGGDEGFSLGLASAYELAAELHGSKERPW